MAASVQIREKNGAGETATDKTSGTVRFKNADNATVDVNDPLVVPSANREYSYEKWLRFYIASGTFTQLENLEYYMDGTNNYGTGIKLWARALSAYSTPGVPTETNDPPQVPVNGTPAAASDAFGYTSGSPLSLGAGPYDSTGLPKDIGSYLCLVAEVEIGAAAGLKTAETGTFAYDEI